MKRFDAIKILETGNCCRTFYILAAVNIPNVTSSIEI